MIRHSEALAAVIRSSHEVITRADLWHGGRLVRARIPLVEGKVTLSSTEDIRGRLTATIVDPTGDLVPIGAGGLSPYGSQLHVWRGARIPGARSELVSLGWYRIQETKVIESYRQNRAGVWVSGGARIEVEGLDRMSAVQDSRFLAPGKPKRGATCVGELRRLCRGLIPLSTWAVDDEPVPKSLVYEESRLEAVQTLASALDAAAYAGPDGTMIVRELAAGKSSVHTFTGSASGGLLGCAFVTSRDGVYNAVVARGEASDKKAPRQATAYDVTPGAPTRWDGPFGRVPTFYVSKVIKTKAQAEKTARSRMDSLIRGRDREIAITAVPVPWLEPGDVVTVRTPRLEFSGRLLTVDMPLSAAGGAATYTVRALESGITTLDPSEPIEETYRAA
ncbi:DUF5047 domain-containing protein [Phytomonospora endophytica]|uniref:DUF5047 domain-containing protein n=1 Tax=Phytomonospora endophytica TaxID=714109 RepID=A0A841FU69_9ACTN|nr:DUF5047 domain-containing protein [Phytomonospora endophytica]MBB6038323.1 hypothetical protein [Phytomonospora endophytica]GIG64254.1 hypothetical protein Pen01_05490 [Phytomonospora endophytica]